MKQRRLLSIAATTFGLLLLSVSVAAAQAPNGNGVCTNQSENCPQAQQGAMQQGQGMMQGRGGMGQGMHSNMQQGQGMMQQGRGGMGQGMHSNMQQGQGMMQGRGGKGQGMQGNMQQGRGMMQSRGGNGQGMQGNMQQGQGMMQGRGGNGQGMQGPTSDNMELHLPAKSSTAPTGDAIAAMKSGIADEYNAYAAYAGIIKQFGNVAPFSNIQRAESHHIDAWSFLFERYGLEVPAAPAAATATKYASETDACKAAAELESDNVKLYDEMLDTLKAYPDMVQVVTSLRTASLERHLPALEQCAGN